MDQNGTHAACSCNCDTKAKQRAVQCCADTCPAQLEPRTKALDISYGVFFNTRVQLKGLQTGCSTRSVHARPGLARQCYSFIFSSLLPLLFATALDAESAPADVLWNTTYQMRCDWCCHVALFLLGGLDIRGKDVKKKKKLALCLMSCTVSPNPRRRLCNFRPRSRERKTTPSRWSKEQ